MRYAVVLMLLASMQLAYGQQIEKLQSLSYELGKNGLVHNIVFDLRLKESRFGLRAITGSNFGRYNEAFTAGGGAYYLAGKNNYHLELGIDLSYFRHSVESDDQVGIGFVYPDRDLNTFYPSANIGYRHTGPYTMFRFGFSPGVLDKEFVPGGYLSFGVRFRRRSPSPKQ